MARITLTIIDTKDGVVVRWKGLPCPVHEKPIELFTAAERFAFEQYRKQNAAHMPLGEFLKHAKNNCPGHGD